ncbi:MAG: class I SAM-dependent methyltransferase [Leptolyngbyaceae bacterium]|nr:class I SAM-dependent methyltransferase [Leptolyngbyaceae bacterium]
MPALLDTYVERLATLFETWGKAFSAEEVEHLRFLLKDKLVEGFQVSSASQVVITYEPTPPPATGINYSITYTLTSIADQYNHWNSTRVPPLFGTHPDAKVMDLAAQLGDSNPGKILDIGAGTGRNTLPLARLGLTVDALELTSGFAEKLRIAAQTENLSVNVIEGDFLDPLVRLRPLTYNLVICAEVISHFRDVNQLRLLLAKIYDYVCPGGLFLFSLFVAKNSYEPDQLTRELSEVTWSTLFTESDLQAAFEQLPLEIISSESVLEYERAHLPTEAWPPTGWFENWASGRDLFPLEEPPMELRWVLCKRV